MKKVILLSSLLIGSAAFAQNAPITFEPGEFGADFTWATFEAPPGEDNPTLTVEANPVTDGINTSATAARIDISYATDATWGQAGCETMHGSDLGSFVFNESNSTVKVMVYQEGFASPVAVKFATPIGAALPEVVVPNTVADEWVEITFDLSAWIDFAENTPDQFIFFPSYAPRSTGHVVWFDNVEFGEGNASSGDPMVSAPDPTIDESEVLSVYSDTYETNVVENFNLNSFQGGGLISEVDIESDGNQTVKIEGLTFYGAEWTAVDLTDYNFVHFDYWSTSSTAFNFYLIDQTAAIPGGAPEEPRYSFAAAGGDETIVQGEWVSVFIPLQHFLDYDAGTFSYDLNDIFQWKFDGNGTLWFDNVYFTTTVSNTQNLEAQGLKAFPNPSVSAWTIASEFSPINEVRVFNALGQVVYSATPNASMTEIDASKLENGMYFTEVRTDLGISTIKLIKE